MISFFIFIAAFAFGVCTSQWFYLPFHKIKKSANPRIFYLHTRTMSLAFDEVRYQAGELYMMRRNEIVGSLRCGYASTFALKKHIESETGLKVGVA